MNFKEHNIEVIIILVASMTTIIALILSFVYPNLQVLILTSLTILLPLIYQVGHIYSKETMMEKNNRDISEAEEIMSQLMMDNEKDTLEHDEETEDLIKDNYELEEENKLLKEKLKRSGKK